MSDPQPTREASARVAPDPVERLGARLHPVTSWPRAAWRFARGLAQVVRGLGIVLFRFPRLDAAARVHEVGRWSIGVLRAIDVRLVVDGRWAGPGTLLAANHVSWLDIIAIHALLPQARFVSKAAVRRWPLFGRLSDAGGTIYLERESKRDARRLVGVVRDALGLGSSVAVFPEGTTGTGWPLLPFHANLLEACVGAGTRIQPIALRYSDAESPFSRAVDFTGATSLVESTWRVVSGRALTVHVVLLPPIAASTSRGDRRALARAARQAIAARLIADAPPP